MSTLIIVILVGIIVFQNVARIRQGCEWLALRFKLTPPPPPQP